MPDKASRQNVRAYGMANFGIFEDACDAPRIRESLGVSEERKGTEAHSGGDNPIPPILTIGEGV